MYTHRLLRRALTHIQRNVVSQPHTNTPHKTRKKWQNGTAIDKCWNWWSHTCACVCGTVDNKSFQMYASRHRHSTPLRQPVSLTVSTNNENICLSSAMLNIPPMFNWLQSQLCTMEKITNKKLEKEKNLRYPELSFKVNLEATSRLWNRLRNRKFFSLIRSIEFRLAQKKSIFDGHLYHGKRLTRFSGWELQIDRINFTFRVNQWARRTLLKKERRKNRK